MIAEQNNAVAVCPQHPSTTFSIAQAIDNHLPLVRKIARIAYQRYGRSFEHDDLVGYGHLGLVKAANKYSSLKHDLAQAIDFSDYAEKRIWRGIEVGRDRMATIHRTHYRMIKRGEISQPQFVHENGEYRFADAIACTADDSAETNTKHSRADEMTGWLRRQNIQWAKVVDLHLQQGMTFEQISKEIGRSPSATASLYRRAVKILRWKYNPASYRHDDRSARRRAARLQSVQALDTGGE